MATSVPPSPYAGWSREQLIERLMCLEPQTSSPSASSSTKIEVAPPNGPNQPKTTRKFDFSQYPRRKIALKFCYTGSEYGGLAFQIDDTPLPTVEGVLFDALAKARLIDSDAGFEGCGWERCGRTDRGVSGAGQVVSLWVRSALPKEELEESVEGSLALPAPIPRGEEGPDSVPVPDGIERRVPQVQSRNEHEYVRILNRMLPETIRIIAWSPVSSKFSARFSCKWRHYKYFFSPQGLDLVRMQDGASRLVGEHDFRNLCKLDPAKQITSFKRNILNAYVERYNDNLHVFNLVGSAFLYNQVRHIMAVLFLVGTGLEPPSLVSTLMNTSEGAEGAEYPIIDRKPEYQMVDGLPLVLWDCGYSEGDFSWKTHGRPPSAEYQDYGETHFEAQNIVERSHVTAALNEHFLQAISKFHAPPQAVFPLDQPEQLKEHKGSQDAIQIPLGAGTSKRVIKYVRVLDRKRLDPVETANERWRLGKGFRKSEKRRLAEESDSEPPKKVAVGGS